MPVDYSEYHPKWELIKRLIRRRAGNRCEECGALQDELHPDTIEVITYHDLFTGELTIRKTGVRVLLGIAHLDQDITNNRFSNLAALCRKCHLHHDRLHNTVKQKYGRKADNPQQKTLFG